MRRLLPGVKSFIQRTSPKTHVSRMKCPVFIFHARDDSNCPFEDSEKMAGLLKAEGRQVTFSPTDTGNHYQSMVEEGIPRGIEWIKSQLQTK